jgi:hypothetical protein
MANNAMVSLTQVIVDRCILPEDQQSVVLTIDAIKQAFGCMQNYSELDDQTRHCLIDEEAITA